MSVYDDLPSKDPNWLRKVGQVEKPKETKKDEE